MYCKNGKWWQIKRNWYRKNYCFDEIIEFEDFDLDNILIDEKSLKNVLVYNISYKLWLVLNFCVLGSMK